MTHKAIFVVFQSAILVSQAAFASGHNADLRLAGRKISEISDLRSEMSLPMKWKSDKKFEMRFLKYSDGHGEIVAIVDVTDKRRPNQDRIVSAVDFSEIGKDREVEFDCFLAKERSCDGLLCNGLLLGVVQAYEARQVKFPKKGLRPTEVWKITNKTLRFERISPKGVVCKPQSYEN